MDIEDKVDIRLTHRIATLTVNVYRMESQIRCNIFTQVNVLLHFPTYCLVSNIKFYTKCKIRRGNRYKKVKVSHSLIAVGAVGVRVPLYLGHS